MKFSDLLGKELPVLSYRHGPWHQLKGIEPLQKMARELPSFYETGKKADKYRIDLYEQTLACDADMALGLLFRLRDIPGGSGQRDAFRLLLRYTALYHPHLIRGGLSRIPRVGRWDDLYFLINTPLEREMWALVKMQLKADLASLEEGAPVSQLAKWLKRANSNSAVTKKLGLYTAKQLGYSVYDYKRVCVKLRRALELVECRMSAGQWDRIDYDNVPQEAMWKYRNAFLRHDEDRFRAHLRKALTGPRTEKGLRTIHRRRDDGAFRDVVWQELPAEPGLAEMGTTLVVAGQAAGGGAYAAMMLDASDRIPGAFQGWCMTSGREPQFFQVGESTMDDRIWMVRQMCGSRCVSLKERLGGFAKPAAPAVILGELLLQALTLGCAPEEIPQTVLIVFGDGIERSHIRQAKYFRQWSGTAGEDLNRMRLRYERMGYPMPRLQLWGKPLPARYEMYTEYPEIELQ